MSKKSYETREEKERKIKLWKKSNPGKSTLQTISNNKKLLKDKIAEMLEKGATEIHSPSKSDLENLDKGYYISYITKDGKYRSGGFLTYIDEGGKYFMLLGGGGRIPRMGFSVQYENVRTLYVRKPVSRKDKVYKITPSTKPKTKWPVKIGRVVVYYAKDGWDEKRFKGTNKYQQMLEQHKNK